MKTQLRSWNRVMTCYLLVAVLIPTVQPAFGATPRKIADVGLTSTGALVGQVVDSQGKPVANSPVEISASGKKAILATTNVDGYFSVNRLPAGVYVAATPGTAKMVRVWAPQTAPPAASDGVLLVQSEEAARAQNGHHHGRTKQFLQDHWVKIALGLGIAGGIVAIVDHKDSPPAS